MPRKTAFPNPFPRHSSSSTPPTREKSGLNRLNQAGPVSRNTPITINRPRVLVSFPASCAVIGCPAHSITTSKPSPSVISSARFSAFSVGRINDTRWRPAFLQSPCAAEQLPLQQHSFRAAESRGQQCHQSYRACSDNRDVVLRSNLSPPQQRAPSLRMARPGHPLRQRWTSGKMKTLVRI